MLLKNGSTGNYVMYLQYGLHIMCCPPGSFDSKFGSGTENAVKKYQGKKGLTQDNLPIIIRLNSSDGKKTHFVTAIAYTGSCSSASSISVIDPAGGVIRTLEEAGTARNETVYGDYIATARRS